MTISKTLFKSLPIVAPTITKRFGVEVEIGGTMAYTNGKRIHLPHFPGEAIDPTVIFGYLLHECGHIRYSKFGVQSKHADQKELGRFLTNVLEDGRIERLVSAEFPGAFHWLKTLDTHGLTLEDSMGHKPLSETDESIRIFTNCVYFWTRIHAAGLGSVYGACLTQGFEVFKKTFGEPFVSEVETVLQKSLQAKSTEDCRDVADMLIDLLKSLADNEPDTGNAGSGSGQNDSDKGDGDQQDSNGGSDSQSSGSGKGQSPKSTSAEAQNESAGEGGQSEGDSADGSDAQSDDSAQPSSGKNARTDASGDDAESVGTDAPGKGDGKGQNCKAAREVLKVSDEDIEALSGSADAAQAIADEMSEKAGEARCRGDDCNGMSEIAVNLSALSQAMEKPLCVRNAGKTDGGEVYAEAARLSVPLERRLRALLEAETRAKTYRSERGRRISSRHLASFAAGNTRIFERKTEGRDVSTAFHVLVDFSASMAPWDGKESRITPAKIAAVALIKALMRIKGINPALSVFPAVFSTFTGVESDDVGAIFPHGTKPNEQMLKSFSTADANGRDTPLAEATIGTLMALSKCSKEARHVIFVITDGDADKMDALAPRLRKSGIETRALFIGRDEKLGVFDHEVCISQSARGEELIKAILDLASQTILSYS